MTEQQYLQAKAELTDRWFKDESYSNDEYIKDLNWLEAQWLKHLYNNSR